MKDITTNRTDIGFDEKRCWSYIVGHTKSMRLRKYLLLVFIIAI